MKRSLSLILFSASVARGFQSTTASCNRHSQQLLLHRRFLASSLHRHCQLPGTSSSVLYSSSSAASTMESTTLPKEDDKYRFLQNENLGGISKIVQDYDVFLLDMWGVMHDGISPYEGVVEVVQQLKQANKKLVILSNSSKRKSNSVKMLKKLGFQDGTFDEIITSGEVAHHLLEYLATGKASSWVMPNDSIPKAIRDLRNKAAANENGKQLAAFCFGSGDGDKEYLESCGWTLADSIETADLIVSRGTFVVQSSTEIANKNENENDYWSAYQNALDKAARASNPIPMIVCNPDKVRPDANKSPMPGTIGVAYRELLAKHQGNKDSVELDDLILSLGKPFSGVYEIALNAVAASSDESVDKSRVVMVGDALETDVTGATVSGIDSIWVIRDGIHNQAILEASSNNNPREGCEAVLQEFNEASESTYARGRTVSPTVVLPHFRW